MLGSQTGQFSINYLFTDKTHSIVYGSDTSLKYGLLLEVPIAYKNSHWSLYTAPTYQSYETKHNELFNVSYKYIQIPLGGRYYFFLDQKSKIHLGLSLNFDIPIEEKIEYPYTEFHIENNFSSSFSTGFTYKNKFGFQIIYTLSNGILPNYYAYDSKYRNISLLCSYTLF